MNEYVLINVPQGSKGKLSNVKVFDITHFIYCPERYFANRCTQITEINGWYSRPIRELSVEQFEDIFNEKEIKAMQDNGRLNYYPNGIRVRLHDGSISNHLRTGVEYKYPIFSAKIYKEYGIVKEPHEYVK